MIPKHYYWYFKKALSPSICNKIIKLGLSKEKEIAITYAVNDASSGSFRNVKKAPLTKQEKQIVFKKRKSHVSWLNDPWLYKLIHPFVATANKNAEWNFEFDWSENMQFTHYTKRQFYGWHNDSSPLTGSDPSTPQYGKIRKLTTVISLSKPTSYQGGQFQMDFRAEDPDESDRQFQNVNELNEQGTLICFPSFVWHRVKPVTKGKRYSLIIWHWGKPFK